jgi:hypothetical protein
VYRVFAVPNFGKTKYRILQSKNFENFHLGCLLCLSLKVVGLYYRWGSIRENAVQLLPKSKAKNKVQSTPAKVYPKRSGRTVYLSREYTLLDLHLIGDLKPNEFIRLMKKFWQLSDLLTQAPRTFMLYSSLVFA